MGRGVGAGNRKRGMGEGGRGAKYSGRTGMRMGLDCKRRHAIEVGVGWRSFQQCDNNFGILSELCRRKFGGCKLHALTRGRARCAVWLPRAPSRR